MSDLNPDTSSTRDASAPLVSRLDRWGLLTVIAITLFALAFFALAPADRLEAGADFLVALVTGLGLVAAFRGPLFVRRPPTRISAAEAPPAPPRPERVDFSEELSDTRRTRRDGSIDVVLEVGIAMLAIGFFVLAALFSSGCASTGGVAGALLAAKPILDTTCMVARRACDLVTRGCDLVSPEPTSSGDEDPWSGFPPALPGHATGIESEDDAGVPPDAPALPVPIVAPVPAVDAGEPLDPTVAVSR